MKLPVESATRLAVARITVAAVWLITGDVRSAATFANLEPSLRAAPRGLHWALTAIPVTPLLAQLAYGVVVVACLAAFVGYWSRTAFATIASVGTYLLYIPQLTGTVLHMHHLVWLAAMLAVSPCGDALSIDARHAAAPPRGSFAYAFPVRVMWALLGCVFLFPGIWKLAHGGLLWISSDNLRNLVGWKALQSGQQPLFDVVHRPWLAHALALGAIIFELSFLFLVFFRRTRGLAVVCALCFHTGIALLLHIHFAPLWLCYTVFLDWDRIAAALARHSDWWKHKLQSLSIATAPTAVLEDPARRTIWPMGAMASVLLVGVLSTGALRIVDGWPFACYPTFDDLTPREMPALLIELAHEDGRHELLGLPRNSRDWAMSWRVLGLYGDRVTPARFDAYWSTQRRRADVARRLGPRTAVHFYRARMDVISGRATSRTLVYSTR